MAKRIKYLVIALIFPIIFGIARFVVNQGDYKYREMLVVIVCLIFLIGAIKYAQRVNLIVVRFLTKKECIQLLLLLLLDIFFVYIYASIFHVSSRASTAFSERRVTGYSISFILSVSIFGPIEEELIFRGFIQNGVFQNSVLGLILTSCLFAFVHGPVNVISFLFYAISGIIYGVSYKVSDNLSLPILSHIGYNSFVILVSLL